MKYNYSIEFETENDNVVEIIEQTTDVLRETILKLNAKDVIPTFTIRQDIEFLVGDIVKFIKNLGNESKCQNGKLLKVVDYDPSYYRETDKIDINEVNCTPENYILVSRCKS